MRYASTGPEPEDESAGWFLVTLAIVALLVVAGWGALGCATTGPFSKCNPVMERCNEADLPPLTAQLPPWPFPRFIPGGGRQP